MRSTPVSVLIRRASLTLAVAALMMFLTSSPAHAQVDAGAILGTVSDTSGASVSGANVTVTNEGTSATLSIVTSGDGAYKFTPLQIGQYTVTVTMQGFSTVTQKHVTVNVGAEVVSNFALKPGAVNETIEVASTVPVLETQDASVGQVMDSRNVNNLPLNGRNFTFLAQLAAGVNTPQADTRGNAASGAFSANGNRPAQNNYLLDGIDNNSDTVDFLNGTNFVVLPPVDAVEEFKVQTSDFSAEFGRSGAAVLNATIKSGTNSFHGAAWEFFRNDKLDAADFFENAGGVPKGELRQNQFGFTAGGPVVIPKLFNGRNKVFFFGDYEGLRRVQGTILTGSVPTAAESGSNFTNFQDLITGQASSPARTDDLGPLDSSRHRSGSGDDPCSGLRSSRSVSGMPVSGLRRRSRRVDRRFRARSVRYLRAIHDIVHSRGMRLELDSGRPLGSQCDIALETLSDPDERFALLQLRHFTGVVRASQFVRCPHGLQLQRKEPVVLPVQLG